MGNDTFQGQMQLTQTVGELTGAVKALDRGQSKIFKVLEKISDDLATANTSHVRTKAEVENVTGDVADIQGHLRKKVDPVLEDYKAKKNRFAGFLVGAGAIGGGAGLSIKALLVKMGFIGG